MKNFVENMLNYALENTEFNWDKIEQYIQMYANDRRYKLVFLAGTTFWSKVNARGIVKYRNQRFYFKFDQELNKIVVESL